MTSRSPWLIAWLLIGSGCTHEYYFARSVLTEGQHREALAVWSVTERALWFDESSETVRVTLECGKTVLFQQQRDGVYMKYDPASWYAPHRIGDTDYCGQVLGISDLDELSEGETLSVAVWCSHKEDDEGMSIEAPILSSGTHALGQVQRSETEPRVRACQSPTREW